MVVWLRVIGWVRVRGRRIRIVIRRLCVMRVFTLDGLRGVRLGRMWGRLSGWRPWDRTLVLTRVPRVDFLLCVDFCCLG